MTQTGRRDGMKDNDPDTGQAMADDSASTGDARVPGTCAPPSRQTEQAQALVVSIINDLLCADTAELDRHIDTALERLGRFADCDRTYLFQIRDTVYLNNTHEWCAEGIVPMIDTLQDLPMALGEVWWREFRRQGHVYVPDVHNFQDDGDLRELLEHQQIRSVLGVPLRQGEELAGFVGYDAVRGPRSFSEIEIELIKSVANVIGTVLHRRDTEAQIELARRDLTAERNRAEAMMNALPDLVLEADADGDFIGYHQTSPMTMAVEPSEIVGQPPEAVLPPEIAALARRMMAETDRRGHAGPEEYSLDLPHGRRWYSAFMSARMPGTPGGRHGYVYVVRDITDETAQRHQIQQLGAIVEQTSSLVILTDTAGHIRWINAACERRTGFTPGSSRGLRPRDILRLDEAMPGEADRICNWLAADEVVLSEIRALDRDGAPWWASVDSRRLHLDCDNAPGHVLVLTDITDRKRAELAQAAATAQAEAARVRLGNAVNALQDAFVYFDRDRRLVLCNAPYRALYPKTAHLLIPGARLEDVIAEAARQGETAAALDPAHPETHPLIIRYDTPRFETERALPDGRWLRILEKATSDGGRVGMMIDITALKNAEARALNDRAAVLDASREGIAFVNADGVVTHANPAFLTLFGIADPALIVGRHWTAFYPPEVTKALLQEAQPALDRSGFWQGEITIPDGTMDGDSAPRVHELSITRESRGMLLCLLRDKSLERRAQQEQARLREDLQHAQRREVIAQIATETAHDFANLLAAISAALAAIDADTRDAKAPELRRIESAINQGTGLLRRLTRLGSRERAPSRLDLRQPVIDAADLVRPSLRPGESIRLALPDTPVAVTADPTDVLQVVLNLLINARDAVAELPLRPDRPAITVRLRTAGSEDLRGAFDSGRVDPQRAFLRLDIADSGAGIAEDARAHVYTPSFTTKTGKGSGLGLVIVRNVLRAVGGHIRLAAGPDGGTIATVLWPVEARDCQPRPAAASSGPADAAAVQDDHALAGVQVLVVDDDDDQLAWVCSTLEARGAEVAGCISAADALETMAEDPAPWDVVITDMQMPDMSGIELGTRIAAGAHSPAMILLTALAISDLRDQIPQELFDAVLRKPVTPAQLAATIAAVLRPTARAPDADAPAAG
ncbi:MAG: PAS domain-containing protein [Rhodobacteraceae bacterium]|nr:PAS domain-containing protein [Paracoccaceae bacterium]